jgi:ribonuclease P protein component
LFSVKESDASSAAVRRFSRPERLQRRADFDRVYRTGRRIFSARLTVFFLPRESGPARIGFTVGRALGGAVERNRIRRRLREAARLAPPCGPADVVIHPRKSVVTAELGALREELARAFRQIGAPAANSGAPRNGGTE